MLGMRLSSPVVVGSGLLTDQERTIRRLLERGAGGVVTKTIHPNPPSGGGERIVRIRGGMLNSTTYSRRPVPAWCDTLRRFAQDGLPVVASVHADSPSELAALCGEIATTGCRGLELGISCINEAGFEDTPERVGSYTEAVRRRVSLPISVKLAVDGGTRARLEAAVRAGADAITLSDTVPGLAVDTETGEPVLGGVYGYSGDGLKPLVLAEIYSLRRNGVGIPILASGGVREAADVVEYLNVGANAVQVYSALHRDMYATLQRICVGYTDWLSRRNENTHNLIGRALRKR
jgi:dihydroorotate dehydrogenase subfamily 1